MTMRTTYRNGDPIDLKHNGCDGCDPCMINGIFCHETGCPDAWRDAEPVVAEDEILDEIG